MATRSKQITFPWGVNQVLMKSIATHMKIPFTCNIPCQSNSEFQLGDSVGKDLWLAGEFQVHCTSDLHGGLNSPGYAQWYEQGSQGRWRWHQLEFLSSLLPTVKIWEDRSTSSTIRGVQIKHSIRVGQDLMIVSKHTGIKCGGQQ